MEHFCAGNLFQAARISPWETLHPLCGGCLADHRVVRFGPVDAPQGENMTLMKPAPHREALPLFGPAALLSGVRRALHAALDARLASDEVLFPLELTTAQLTVVMMLASGETLSSVDLCESMSYDTGAMTRMLDRLQSKGVIRRRRSLEDRRVVEVELTEEGRAGLSRMREISTEVADEFLRGFTTAEVLRLESYLARLLVNVQS